MTTPSSSAGVAEQFLITDWNPLVSMDRNVDFDGSSGISSYSARVPQNQGIGCSNTVIEQCQRPHTFNSESIPEAVNSLDLRKSTQISSSLFPPVFHLNNRHGMENSLKGQKRKSMSQYGALHPHSPKDRIQNAENEQQKNVSTESVKSSTEKEKKQKTENPSCTIHKPIASHAEGFSKNSDAPKEDYIHVRAKRGQATNSHSLAERVRREKISERMKLLQDLVPGCSKITGKAMMLDEIINYVQSLQRQVEFLSMKLASVNPELPIDIEQILSKDIVHFQDGSLAALGCGPGMNVSHPHLPPQGFMQPEMMMCNISNSGDMMSSVIPQVSSMAQLSRMWDDELQTGFIPNLHFICSDLSGSMKMEL